MQSCERARGVGAIPLIGERGCGPRTPNPWAGTDSILTPRDMHSRGGRARALAQILRGFGANGPPRHNTLGTWHHANCGVSVDTNQEMEDVVAPRYEQTVRSIVA